MSARLHILAAFGLVGLMAACSADPSMPDSQTAATEKRIQFIANMDGRQETPPVATEANGSGTIVLDRATRRLSWDLSYNNMSSPVTGAHFHGPSGPGVASDVQLSVAMPTGATDEVHGEAQLTDEQMREVLAGLWYVNIHTEAHPDGEIRGQVENAGM